MGKLSWLDDAVKGAARNLDDAAQAAANQLDMSKAARMQRAGSNNLDDFVAKYIDNQPLDEFEHGEKIRWAKKEISDRFSSGNVDDDVEFKVDRLIRDQDAGQYFDEDGELTQAGLFKRQELIDSEIERLALEEVGGIQKRSVDFTNPQEAARFIKDYYDSVGIPVAIDGSSKSLSKYIDVNGTRFRISDHALPDHYVNDSDVEIILDKRNDAALEQIKQALQNRKGAATIGGMATAGVVGAGLMGAQAYDFGTPDYDAKIQEFRNRRAAKSQIWKELKEAGATIASAIPAGIISDAYRIGGYLSPVTPVEETERGAEIVQNALMYTPEGDNRYLNEFARQVNQFGQDVEPLVNAWKQTPIYRGYKQLPQRIQGLIKTASDYAF